MPAVNLSCNWCVALILVDIFCCFNDEINVSTIGNGHARDVSTMGNGHARGCCTSLSVVSARVTHKHASCAQGNSTT